MARPGQEMANVNFSRYSSAVHEVAQQEVWRVFHWLHHHHYHGQPPAYVGQRLRESKGGMNRITSKERAALNDQDDPATMDIPLLYRLLQHTCGLRQDGPGFDWTSPRGEEQRQSLEHQLYLIKEARNRLCHCPKLHMHLSDPQLDMLLKYLQRLLCHSLQQAGQRSGRPAGEVDDAVASVRDRLAHIQAYVPPSAITPQEFALLARAELQEQWEGLSITGEWLSPPMLRWAVGEQVVTLDQLLQGPGGEEEEPPRVLAVVGEAGIGKSSLCRQMEGAWLKGEAAAAAAAVEVVVMVELREVFTRDLTRLILQKLLPQTCHRCHPEEVLRLLGALRVLWLLDGFDEASADAKELLRFLVEWCRRSSGSHVVVVTCQSEYMEDLNARLAPTATPCYVTHCGLTQQGLHSLLATLLQGGQEAVGEGKVKQEQNGSNREAGVEARCQAFLKEVEELDPNLPRELHNPLKLVLAVQLWQEGRLREVAGASLPRLYAAIQEVMVTKLVARLQTKSPLPEAEARERVKQWVAGLCGVALAMSGRGCFVSLDEAAEQMLKDQAVKLLLLYTDCFSTFLVCSGGPGPRHSFLHHTQQRVFAAQHLQTLLLQDHTSQELLALMLPATPTTATTTTTATPAPTTNTTNGTTTIDITTSTTKTTTTDTTASTTTTNTSLDQTLDIMSQLSLNLDPTELVDELNKKIFQLPKATDAVFYSLFTGHLYQAQDRLSQLSLHLDHMEQLVNVLKKKTDKTITTFLYRRQDRLSQVSLLLDHKEELVKDLKKKAEQITTSLYQAQDRLSQVSLRLDHKEVLLKDLKKEADQITTSLYQAQDRLSQVSLRLDHKEELLKDLKKETDQTTPSLYQAQDILLQMSLRLDHTEERLKDLKKKTDQITTSLYQTQDRRSQLLLRLDHTEKLIRDLKIKTDQTTTIPTSLYQRQDRLSKLSLDLDHMKQSVEVMKQETGHAITLSDAKASTTITLDHCLDILVHAAASLEADGSLNEGRAKVLAELLQQCRQCPWLEVVHRTACCRTLAREVGQRLGEAAWEVTGSTVQAAAVLAAIHVPAVITITLHDNPDDLPHLMPLLHCLAKTPAYVTLHNFHSFYSTQSPRPCDSLLLPLCDPASLCRLEIFSGVLTAKGCRALRQQQQYIKELHVGVLEPAALEELLQLTHTTDRLNEVRISLYNIFADRPSKSVAPGVWVHLHLPHVKDKEAEPAVALASCISHTFKRVVLGTVSSSTVCSMVRAFRKERVRTPSLCKEEWINFNNNWSVHWIHRFPLPLPTGMSERDVNKMWNNFPTHFVVGAKPPFSVEEPSLGFSLSVGMKVSSRGARQGSRAGL